MIFTVKLALSIVFVKDKSDNYELQLRMCDLLLNQNNLHRLKHQNIRNLSSSFFGKSNLYINTLRNWINTNLSPLEKERLILFGDIVLTSYGIKTINKIEGIFISIGDDFSEREKNIEEQINNVFNNIDSKFYFTLITRRFQNT